jgi:hypothetical protein
MAPPNAEIASTISNAKTLTPDDSASQVTRPNKPPESKVSRPQRASKTPADKDGPQGAVQVPPGKVAPGPASKVTSATIPLTGWGNIDHAAHRRYIEPTFTVDTRPYADLVDTGYSSIQSRFSAAGKHIPRSLFVY